MDLAGGQTADLGPALGILIVLGIMTGWLVPLVIGIIRRCTCAGGKGWFILSGIWGFAALCLIGLMGYGFYVARQYSNVETFDARTYSGETGKIVLPFKGEVALVLRDSKNHKLLRCGGKDGIVRAPTGIYGLHRFEGSLMDEQKGRWTAGAYFFRHPAGDFTLENDGERTIEAGPPFVARIVAATKGRDEAEFNLELTGRGEGRYTITKDKGALWEPGFEVLSKAGDVLWRGNFKFG
ncbi:MAG TPA: hypothetical protein PLU30_08935 [Verrucomicrobiae bacterium]|nr:hypothetical protein [Verrucomicrobiae bacterium]